MLARTIEAAGISTVLVTGMPVWSQRVGVPRTLGVEFPYGHPLGRPGDRETHLTVIRAALTLLAEATEPETVCELDLEWPQDLDEAKKDWQPAEPSPIVKLMIERRRAAAEAARRPEAGGGS